MAIAWNENQAIGYYHLLDGPLETALQACDRPREILRFYVDSRWHGAGVEAALTSLRLEQTIKRI